MLRRMLPAFPTIVGRTSALERLGGKGAMAEPQQPNRACQVYRRALVAFPSGSRRTIRATAGALVADDQLEVDAALSARSSSPRHGRPIASGG
jgi:hypothetical protein